MTGKWNQSRFIFHLTQTTCNTDRGEKISSNWMKRLKQFSANFQTQESEAWIATCSNGSCRVQCNTHNRWGWRSDMDKLLVYSLQTCRNSHPPHLLVNSYSHSQMAFTLHPCNQTVGFILLIIQLAKCYNHILMAKIVSVKWLAGWQSGSAI